MTCPARKPQKRRKFPVLKRINTASGLFTCQAKMNTA
jgi:hypothetical protein